MVDYLVKFKGYLAHKGLKLTPEREIILKEIFSYHKHFNTEALYEKLRQKGETISLATIYRTLPLLIESDLIRETLRCQGKVSYEHTFGHEHHDHIVCIKCGKVIEFQNSSIKKMRDTLCRKYNFKPVEHRLGIKGYCDKCKKKGKSK